MNNILKWKMLVMFALTLTLAGCAATRITIHAIGDRPPLCRSQPSQPSALILWGAAWRSNQKEVSLREEIASRAISRFFADNACFSNVQLLKSVNNRSAIELSDVEALKFAEATGKHYDRVILLRVEELGPLLILYISPILWEGGTEAVIRVRLLNTATSALEADITTHWRESGAFVLKGTHSLERDLQAALAAVFLSGSPDGKLK
jgi:hypothetical protein